MSLSRKQKQRVAAMMKARGPVYAALVNTETDLDVLRQLNWQIKRLPKSERGEALNNRLAELTGKRPADGLSGHERWFTRGVSTTKKEVA
jgi:hypothetical protein